MPRKTVKNISGFTQLGLEPGETGEVDFTQDEEDRMTNRGAIEIVDGSASTSEASTDGQEEAEKTPEEIEAEEQAAKEQAEAEEREAQRGGRRGR